MARVPRRVLPLAPGVFLGIGQRAESGDQHLLRWAVPCGHVDRDGRWSRASPPCRRRSYAWSGYRLLGGIATGWGGFNVVEGIVDHHLLGLHHVEESAASPLPWDLGFLAFGAAFVLAGGVLSRRGLQRAAAARDIPRAA